VTEARRRWSRLLAPAAALLCAGVATLTAAAVARAADTPQPSGTVVPLAAATRLDAVANLREATFGPTVDAGREFNLLGALVRGRGPAELGVTVRVRTSGDGGLWSEWLPLEFPASAGPAGSAFDRRDTVSEPVWVGRARFVQLGFDGPAASVGAVAATLRLAFVTSPWDDRETAPAVAEPAAGTAVRLAAKPAIVTRRQWGANESWRRAGPFYGHVRMVFIHHTVTSNSYTAAEAPAIVRSVYYYHARVNGFNDIGYNFLVDRYGKIYEGRYGGMTKSVSGAQTLGFNSCSTGVSVIGTYTSARPPAAAIGALERLLAWKLDVHHINPQGYVTVRCQDGEKFPEGAWVRFNVISGHRQANYTTCPGNGIFSQIGAIRSKASAIGQPKIFAPKASPAVFSPNGDGQRERSTAVCNLSQSADWKVEVRNDLKQVVRRFSGHGGAVAAEWNGRDDGGEPLPDGRYTYVMSAENESGAARNAEVGVRIDTGAPPLHDVRCSPLLVSPNGDGVADRSRILFTVAETCEARVSLFDSSGALVRRVRDWARAPRGVNAVWWDGKVVVDGARVAAPDGSYRVRVEARDSAGNAGTAAGSVAVNSTVGFVVVDPLYFSPNGDGVKDACDLGFRLARPARVTVSVVSGSEVLRKWALGDLGAGARSVRWDGRGGDGAMAASGRFSVAVTAVNEIGTVTVRRPVRVDRYRPRPSTPDSVAKVRLGSVFKLGYSVRDPYSPSVKVTIVVRDASGAAVKTAEVGWVTSNRSRAWSYKAPARGVYTVSVQAQDKAGNREAAAARVTLTVR